MNGTRATRLDDRPLDDVRRGAEVARITRVYEGRSRRELTERYALANPAALFEHQHRVCRAVELLRTAGLFPLSERRILDVGCGAGQWLIELESLGAHRDLLSGIDLSPDRIAAARNRLAQADIRVGDASALPWSDAQFQIVTQNTVFSSILDRQVRRAVAREIDRVLRPGGAVLWYDLRVDNPFNGDVVGIPRKEIAQLFYGYQLRLTRITLAPPIARSLIRISPFAAHCLERLSLLNTHVFGLLRKPLS